MTRQVRFNRWRLIVALALLLALLPTTLLAVEAAANYVVNWWTVNGGGGESAGGNYTLDGTIGQADASLAPPSGGAYSVRGGFWTPAQPVGPLERKLFLPLANGPQP